MLAYKSSYSISFQKVHVVGEDYCEETLNFGKMDANSKKGYEVKPMVLCVAFNYTYRFQMLHS